MQENYTKNKSPFYTQNFQENDFVRNSFQKQCNNNYYVKRNQKNFHNQTSPVKRLHPFQNLISPKGHIKTPYFSSNDIKQSPNHFNFTSFKNISGNNKFDKPQNFNIQQQQKYFQMQNTISQLKISLHQSLDNQSKLQQQLHHQKTRNFQLFQLKRRLEQQLSKMQFQLDRINEYDSLQHRQAIIKKQSVQAQNQNLSRKVDDLHQQLKKIKKQHRDLMTEHNSALNQSQILIKQNRTLIQRVHFLENQLNYQKNESQENLQKKRNLLIKQTKNKQKNNNFQTINQIDTTRSNQHDSIHVYSPNNLIRIKQENQKNEIKYFQSPATTKPNSKGQPSCNKAYQEQNSKLLQDYQRLLLQNQSMKKLCQQFYQENTQQQNHHQLIESRQREKDLLKTYQKDKLQKQVDSLRQEVINQLITKYYQKTLKQTKRKNKNCLIIFIKQVQGKIQILNKMVLNYLMARDILNKQTENAQSQHFNHDSESSEFYELSVKVKQNLKKQLKKNKQKQNKKQIITLNINSYFLALFRLLTLIYRGNRSKKDHINNYIKHLSLKYIHKIYEEKNKIGSN